MSARSYYLGAVLLFYLVFGSGHAAEGMADSDADGLTDLDETRIYKTDIHLSDTDTDGLSDGLEINQYWTLPLVSDTDADHFLDGVEVRLGTDPTDASDYPTDKTAGFFDLDGDGINNDEETALGTDPQRVDSDFDGLNDFVEIRRYFSSPILRDSDADGVWDGEEVTAGSDPNYAEERSTLSK
jgi:Bacterial TSP3 repeat